MNDRRYTMITGASSGLGKEFAIQCAKKGMNLILIALPDSNIEPLAIALRCEYEIDVRNFCLDVSDVISLRKLTDEIQRNYIIDFLINNVGIGGTSVFTDTPCDYIDKIIQVNVRSTAILTHQLIPCLMKNKRSFILNVSSMAAFTPIAYKTVYPASKAFISSFSLGLREELKNTGISVSVLYPGAIMTTSSTTRRIIAHGIKARIGLLPTSQIVKEALTRTLKGQAIIIPGRINRMNRRLLSMLPLEIKLRMISREVKIEM